MGGAYRLDLTPAARRRAEAAGEAGRKWLADLPGMVGSLARDWGLSLGGSLGGGTEACVIEAELPDGRAAVLKVAPPYRDPAARESQTLAAAQGRGYARLYAHDVGRGALLLERLGPQLAELGWPAPRQVEALCETLRSAWRAPPDTSAFTTGAEKAAELSRFTAEIWEELGRPCSAAAVERAQAYARERAAAFVPASAVLAHGDAHAWNALQAPGGDGFRFVDPDGLFIEPAYDLGVVMREWAGDLMDGDPLERGRARCLQLSGLTGVDPRAIWQWGFMERVSSGLLCLKLGVAEGREMLDVAEAWAQAVERP